MKIKDKKSVPKAIGDKKGSRRVLEGGSDA